MKKDPKVRYLVLSILFLLLTLSILNGWFLHLEEKYY